MPLNEAGASVPVLIEVCLHEPGCLLDPNWFASLGRLAKSIVMLLDLLLVCLGPLVANGPLARLIRVDESGQLVLPPSGERVVGRSGFCPPHLAPNTLLAVLPALQHMGWRWPCWLLGRWHCWLLGRWPCWLLGLGCGGCLWPCFVFWVVSSAAGMMQWLAWLVWQAASWLPTSLVLAMPVLVEDLLCACSGAAAFWQTQG